MKININDISETALLMVLAHAQDAKRKNSVLNDQSSIKVLDAMLSADIQTNPRLERVIRRGKIDNSLTNYIVLRAQYYDQQVIDFATHYGDVTIVNIGCGLDGRFERVDDGKMTFIDLDFSDIINIKRELFTPSERYQFVAQSVFEMSWMDRIKTKHVLFLAEGVFMYCKQSDVRHLFETIEERFPGSRMVCELYNSLYLGALMNTFGKMVQRLKYGFGESAGFTFGVRNGKEIAAWSEGIQHHQDWSHLDSRHAVLGHLSILRHGWMFRSVIWTSSYTIG